MFISHLITCFPLNLLLHTGVELTSHAEVVSGEQRGDPVTHI